MSFALLLFAAPLCVPRDDEAREVVARIEAVARHVVESEGVPGLAIAVLRDGELMLSKGWGYADPARRLPASGETRFPIATVGRQLTAAAILRLAEREDLKLDDPIERWLPSAAETASGIQLTHMLAGTSGIPGPRGWLERNPELLGKPVKVDEFAAIFSRLRPEFAPGADFSLDSSGYALLSIVVANASGRSYTEFVTREVTEPIGLEGIRVCAQGQRAVGYAGDCEHTAGEGEFDLPLASDAAGFGHHWCASVEDLVRFERALFDRSLLQEKSILRMTTPVELSGGRSTGYGYALAIETIEGRRAYSHTGGSGGFRVRTAHYVEPDLTIAVLANCHCAPVDLVEREVAAAVLGWPPRMMVEVPLEPRDLERYVGAYQLATTRVRIAAVDGRLHYEGAETAMTLLYQGRHLFASAADKDVLVKFEVEDGRAVSFTLTRGGFESTARRME